MGVILHRGTHEGGGHYTAVCWTEEGYTLFDDKVHTLVSWDYLENAAQQRDAYFLMYTRVDAPGQTATGTPPISSRCTLGAASEQLIEIGSAGSAASDVVDLTGESERSPQEDDQGRAMRESIAAKTAVAIAKHAAKKRARVT